VSLGVRKKSKAVRKCGIYKLPLALSTGLRKCGAVWPNLGRIPHSKFVLIERIAELHDRCGLLLRAKHGGKDMQGLRLILKIFAIMCATFEHPAAS
jgi:hypothetical protein